MKILVSSLLCVLLASIGNAESIVWVVQSHKNDDSNMYKTFDKFIVEPINEELAGKFKIIFNPQNLTKKTYSNKATFSAVQHGELAGMFSAPMYWGNANPILSVVGDLPAAWGKPEDFIEWFDADGMSYLEEVYNKFDMHLVGYTPSPHESLVSVEPITGVNSFKGKLIRTPPGAMGSDYFTALGAVPRKMAMSVVPKALDKGLIEIADYSTVSINLSEGLYEQAKHTNYPGFHSMPVLDFVVNKKMWEELPPYVRASLDKHVANWQKANLKAMRQEDKEALQAFEKSGVSVHKWSDAEMKKARTIASKVWDAYTEKNKEVAPVMNSIKSWLKGKGQL